MAVKVYKRGNYIFVGDLNDSIEDLKIYPKGNNNFLFSGVTIP